jgi:hypothetical protein
MEESVDKIEAAACRELRTLLVNGWSCCSARADLETLGLVCGGVGAEIEGLGTHIGSQ